MHGLDPPLAPGGAACRRRAARAFVGGACVVRGGRLTAGTMALKSQVAQMESTHSRVFSGVVEKTRVFRMGPTIRRSATASKPLPTGEEAARAAGDRLGSRRVKAGGSARACPPASETGDHQPWAHRLPRPAGCRMASGTPGPHVLAGPGCPAQLAALRELHSLPCPRAAAPGLPQAHLRGSRRSPGTMYRICSAMRRQPSARAAGVSSVGLSGTPSTGSAASGPDSTLMKKLRAAASSRLSSGTSCGARAEWAESTGQAPWQLAAHRGDKAVARSCMTSCRAGASEQRGSGHQQPACRHALAAGPGSRPASLRPTHPTSGGESGTDTTASVTSSVRVFLWKKAASI